MGTRIINVKAAPYGAKGDGVTDDLAAFQAANDAHVGPVYVPPGTYFFFRDGGTLNVSNDFLGPPGRSDATITSKNAYAFNIAVKESGSGNVGWVAK